MNIAVNISLFTQYRMGLIVSNDVEVTLHEGMRMTASVSGQRTVLRHGKMVYNCCDDTPLCHGQADLRYPVRALRWGGVGWGGVGCIGVASATTVRT
jgi:hypothetical protein